MGMFCHSEDPEPEINYTMGQFKETEPEDHSMFMHRRIKKDPDDEEKESQII